MLHDLRLKFVLVNMTCVVLILVAVFTAIFISNTKDRYNESLDTLNKELELSKKNTPDKYNIEGDSNADSIEELTFVITLSYDGTMSLYPYYIEGIGYENAKSLMDTALSKDKKIGEIKNSKLRFMVENEDNGVRIAFIDLTNEIRFKKNMFIISLVSGIVALCGFFLVSIILSRWALRPVEKAWNQQKRFAADASHELKTPLTVILANMEILKSNKCETIEDRMEWVENTEAEAKRMKNLANHLLFLTKTGELRQPDIKAKVNLSDAVIKSSLAFEPVAYEKGIFIAPKVENGVFTMGDESQIKQLMTILLDNAVKYSYENTTITVNLKNIAQKAVLEVNNKGVPISKEDTSKIFHRFYRSDESRSDEGYGLGLSIAQNIVNSHKGTIIASSDEEDGTTFTVSLPVYKV